jgi:hypothetical protein
MPQTVIPGPLAWTRLAASKVQQWEDIAGRFADPFFTVTHRPKFPLGTDDRFFCIGSCFARNVEEHLIYRGVAVLSRKIVSPRAEWPGPRPNGLVNKFTTASMAQEVEWLFDPPTDVAATMVETPQGWFDLHLCPGVAPVALERAIERRRYLMEDYFARLRQADAVIVTLGLNEVWRDLSSGLYLNTAPTLWATRKTPGRFQVEITGVEENVVELERLYARLKALNPAMRVIVTVSPVPMSATFSGRDVAVANTFSKSTLVAAAQVLQGAHEDVDYFPSYELVTLSPRAAAYGADSLHVTNAVVGRVMEQFMTAFMGAAAAAPNEFVDLAYLEANPDVEDAVRAGLFVSGYEHWLEFGRREKRSLRPAEATARMIEAGM